MTLIDTNVLSDLLSASAWAEWSRHELSRAATRGALLINEVVYAEICPLFDDADEADHLVETLGLELVRTPRPALFQAAKAHMTYRKAEGSRTSVLPDFFIGAHAQALDCPLLTRDARRYRTYFPDVRLITP